MGNGGCGQSITQFDCRSFLLVLFPWCSCVGSSPRGHRFSQKTCSSLGSCPRDHRSCQEPTPMRNLTWSQLPSGHIHLLWRGVSTGCRVDICSTMDLHGLHGDNLCHHGLHHGLQGNLCSGTWSTSSPPSSLTLSMGWRSGNPASPSLKPSAVSQRVWVDEERGDAVHSEFSYAFCTDFPRKGRDKATHCGLEKCSVT